MQKILKEGKQLVENISKSRAPYYLLAALLLLGAHIRFVALDEMDVIAPVRADAMDYLLYAHNLQEHGIYSRSGDFSQGGDGPSPDAVRSPGYPVFLIPFLGNPPQTEDIETIKLIQALMGVATIALAFVAAVAFMSPMWALVPTLLVAISPHLVSHSAYLITETLFTFLLLAGIALFVHAARARESRLWVPVLIGALFGLGALTRPTLMYFGVAFLVVCILPLRFFPPRYAALFLLGSLLVVTPWLLRNYSAIGTLTDPQLVINTLHHGMYPGFMYQDRPETHGFPYRFDPGSDEFSKSVDATLGEIRRRFTEEPLRHFIWFFAEKPFTLMSWGIINGAGDIYTYPVRSSPYENPGFMQSTLHLMKILHWPLVIMSLIMTLVVWLPHSAKIMSDRQLLAARGVSLVMLYFLAVHVVGAPFPRYSIPLRPIMYILATLAILHGSVFMANNRSRVVAGKAERSV